MIPAIFQQISSSGIHEDGGSFFLVFCSNLYHSLAISEQIYGTTFHFTYRSSSEKKQDIHTVGTGSLNYVSESSKYSSSLNVQRHSSRPDNPYSSHQSNLALKSLLNGIIVFGNTLLNTSKTKPYISKYLAI